MSFSKMHVSKIDMKYDHNRQNKKKHELQYLYLLEIKVFAFLAYLMKVIPESRLCALN